MDGYLLKEGARRFFKLDEKTFNLSWFSSPSEETARGSLSLLIYTKVAQNGPMFRIYVPEDSAAKEYKLMASSISECINWVDKIREVIRTCLELPDLKERRADLSAKRRPRSGSRVVKGLAKVFKKTGASASTDQLTTDFSSASFTISNVSSGAADAGGGGDPAAPSSTTRTKVAREILSTEETYVEGLLCAVDFYQVPLVKFMKKFVTEAGEPVVSAETMDTIFSNIEAVRHVNEALLDSVRARMATWSDDAEDPAAVNASCLGDVFVEFAPSFSKVYCDYVSRFPDADSTLRQACEDKPEFARLLQEKASTNKGRLDLTSLLILPVQRVPRYLLLLKELLKATPPDHPDAKHLTEAIQVVKLVATVVDQAQKTPRT